MALRSVLLWLLVIALAPAAARAEVVPGKGMLGIEVGMTRAQVVAAAGEPTSSGERPDPITLTHVQLYYARPAVRVIMRPGRDRNLVVSSVSTRRGRERTAKGIGVGSTEGALRRSLAGERCRTDRYGGRASRQCWIGPYDPGTLTTVFAIAPRTRIVITVLIGIVID